MFGLRYVSHHSDLNFWKILLKHTFFFFIVPLQRGFWCIRCDIPWNTVYILFILWIKLSNIVNRAGIAQHCLINLAYFKTFECIRGNEWKTGTANDMTAAFIILKMFWRTKFELDGYVFFQYSLSNKAQVEFYYLFIEIESVEMYWQRRYLEFNTL